jgi:hypothetical protein
MDHVYQVYFSLNQFLIVRLCYVWNLIYIDTVYQVYLHLKQFFFVRLLLFGI